MKYPCPKCGRETIKVPGAEQRHGWGRWCYNCEVWVKPILKLTLKPSVTCLISGG
ncbi:hypothetical protein ES703_124004 [subsurface metagenome]